MKIGFDISSLFQEPVTVLDFETSKSMDNEPGIPIQIGCIQYGGNGQIARTSKYIYQRNYEPEMDILCVKGVRTSIAELTGIYSSHLRSQEYDSQRILPSEILDLNITNSIIVGYNIPYDVRVLQQVYKSAGLVFPEVKIFDLMSVYIDLYGQMKMGVGKNGKCFYTEYRLADAAHVFGVADSKQRLHDALGDVDLTVAVFRKIYEDNPSLRYSNYINKIYYNPNYPIPMWQRLRGTEYYSFGSEKGEAELCPRQTLYNSSK